MEALLPGLSSLANIHPLFVHFPIALWTTALLFWALALVRDRDHLWAVGRWLVYLSLLASLPSIGSGLWAAETLGHDSSGHDLVHIHRNWMFAASALGLATGSLAFVSRRRGGPGPRWSLLGMLLATVVVTMLGADRGAVLVFGHGMGAASDSPPPVADSHDHEADEH
jgi:uncharacterized membrane protein